MIDTITARHSFLAVDCERVLSRLSQVHENGNRETGEVSYRGKANNLIVNVLPAGSIQVHGSLCKYYLGTNAQTLTRKAIGEAIECLSDDLGIDMRKARISRIDIGENFILKHPVVQYISRLGSARHHRKMESYQGGRRYSNSTGSIILYNKQLEMKKHKVIVPDVFLKYPNILRIERQYQNRLPEKFERKKIGIIGSDLFDEDFYIHLLIDWKESYFSIQKLKPSEGLKLNSQKSMNNSIWLIGVHVVGVDHVIQQINSQREAGIITKETASKMRKSVRDKVKVKRHSKKELGIMQELDEKVSSAAMFYR